MSLLCVLIVACNTTTKADPPLSSDHESHMSESGGHDLATSSSGTAVTALNVTPVQAQPVLLRSYQRMTSVTISGVAAKKPEYGGMFYRPRQFNTGLNVDYGTTHFGTQIVTNPGNYANWDLLSVPNLYFHTTGAQSDYLQVELNRPATVAVVWRPTNIARPAWLADWSAEGTVSLNNRAVPVYRKTFAAGTVNLGKVGAPSPNGSQNYFVLLGEQTGVASSPPAVPAGQTVPVPNTACPTWVHDQYVAVGPDGKSYPTWHPKIDRTYWCSFGHEHGSDPALAGVNSSGKPVYQPLYGYIQTLDEHVEPHAGYKTHAVKDRTTGHWWLWTVHMGSSGQGRVCQQFHSMDVGIVVGGVKKADIHLMGDFGRAKYGGNGAPAITNLVTGCPVNQTAIRDMGMRGFVTDSSGYEPWVVDSEYNVTGLKPEFFSPKTNFPATDCANPPSCTQLKPASHGEFGTVRFLEFSRPKVAAGSYGRNSGTFYTDVEGKGFVAAGAAMSVQQYIEPGFSSVMTPPIDASGYCSIWDGWTEEYKCHMPLIVQENNIERSVGFGN